MDSTSPVLLDFPRMSSNLSPYFQNLICKECISDRMESRVLDEDGFLNFDFVSACLPESDRPGNDSPEYFTQSVRILAPMLNSVEKWMMSQGKSNICDSLCNWTSWTSQQKMMTDLFGMMFTDDDISDITILLASTAILERALGNVYLIHGPPPCLSMLKDLLVSKPLIDLLGTSVIQLLRIIIGPPISLNIRNVVWHGFPLPREIPRRCIWFILLLVPSIGHVLHSKGIAVTQHREPVVFPEVALIQDNLVVQDAAADILRVVNTSQFVGWDTTPFWDSVRDLYHNGRYALCAGLLCYYLEQGLRRVFAVVNKCENRILTAESSTLFTTFDEILSPFLQDNTENKLCRILGESNMEILLDHLVYQDGPRVRDRLSHGEADWFSFPKPLTDNLIALCMSLTVNFCPKESHDKSDMLAELSTRVQTYRVQFHRISVIKNMVSKLYQQVADFNSFIRFNTNLTDRDAACLYDVTEDHTKFEDIVKTVCNEVVCHWTNIDNKHHPENIVESMPYIFNTNCHSMMENILHCKITTLYREAKPPDTYKATSVDVESEVLSLLNHVTAECLTTLTNLRTFACLRQQQLIDKQLRSRQRENFKKFLSSFPSYIVALKLYGYLVTWQLYQLDELKTHTDVGSVTRYWKNILQCCENLRTCTHEEKNKWTEGLVLIQKHILLLSSTLNKLFI